MKIKNVNLNSELLTHSFIKRMSRYEARKRALVLPVITVLLNILVMIIYGAIQVFN